MTNKGQTPWGLGKEVPYESNQNEAYWHSQLESNQHQQSQSLLCYRYTMTA